MSVWGTARSLSARFDVGQDSSDLYVRFEVGQDSRNLSAAIVTRLSAYRGLDARLRARHSGSDDLSSNLVVKPSAFAELYSASLIRNSSSASVVARFFRGQDSSRDLGARVEIQRSASVGLYGRLEVGQDSAVLLARFSAAWPASEDLAARAEVAQPASVDLTSNLNVKQSASRTLLARFEVGQDARDLPAKLEVGQGSQDLLCWGTIKNTSFSDLQSKVNVIHWSVLLGKAVIVHPTHPLWLLGKFKIRLTNAQLDLRSTLKLRHSSYSECLSKAAVRHTGAPVELFGKCWVPYLAVAELPGEATVINVGSQDLLCNVTVQSLGDLHAKFEVRHGLWDSVIPIFDDDLIYYMTYLVEIGQGFIGSPVIEIDGSEKMVGKDSFKITSSYEAGGYKEIRFGWRFGIILPPANSYFNLIGSIWLQEHGGYYDRIEGSVGLFVDEPVGWGGAYFDR